MSDDTTLTSRTRPSWGQRLVGIEGLRGVAAASVVVGHVQVHLAPGVAIGAADRVVGQMHHGLTLFFALSGFLLYRPFAAAILAGTAAPSAKRFLTNRALRIYPAYVVIFLLSSYVLRTTYVVSVSDEGGVSDVNSTLGPVTEPLDVLLNLPLLQTFWPGSVKTGLGAAWSLSTELTFYLVLPVLAAAALALARRGLKPLLAATIVPLALLLTGVIGKLVAQSTLDYDTPEERFFQLWGNSWHAVLERSLLVHADLFAYGAAAAVLFVMAERHMLSAEKVQLLRWVSLAAFTGIALLLVGPGLPSHFGTARWEAPALAGACAALILAVTLPTATGKPTGLGRIAETAPLAYSGLISYSVYLWHLPVLWWLEIHGFTAGRTPGGLVVNVLLVLAATYVLATATYYLVEAPALRRKKRTDNGRPAAAGPDGPVVETTVKPDAVLPEQPTR